MFEIKSVETTVITEAQYKEEMKMLKKEKIRRNISNAAGVVFIAGMVACMAMHPIYTFLGCGVVMGIHHRRAVWCKLRGKHKMDMYTHTCKCGYTRVR